MPPGRLLAFLEGGYDLDALRDSSAAALTALAGDKLHPEAPTGGGPGRDMVTAAAVSHARAVERERLADAAQVGPNSGRPAGRPSPPSSM